MELDLRKPKIREYLGTQKEQPGVSEFLNGKCKLKDLICTLEDTQLSYIIAGKTPFNPHELLMEDALGELINQLKKQYDVIIIDTPPVGLVSDALLLNEFVTDTLFVVRAGVTKKQMLKNANELLAQNKLTNTSILFNGVNINRGYGYKRYGYGGKYGYYQN